MTEPVAGWYPDPSGDASKIRYWDGSSWTNHYLDNDGAASSAYPNWQSEAVAPPSYNQSPGYPNQPVDSYYVQPTQPNKDRKTMATLSSVFALLGLLLSLSSFCLVFATAERGGSEIFIGALFVLGSLLAIPTFILAILGLKSSRRSLAIIALILVGLGVVAFVGFIALSILLINSI